jgi:hypothetical protein
VLAILSAGEDAATAHFGETSSGSNSFYNAVHSRTSGAGNQPNEGHSILTPEAAIWRLNPYHNPDGVDLRQYRKMKDQERREDERIQYGPLKSRLKRQRQNFLAAKRKTRGTKALNPFIAQAITNKPK